MISNQETHFPNLYANELKAIFAYRSNMKLQKPFPGKIIDIEKNYEAASKNAL
jgi:hypothetical protein